MKLLLLALIGALPFLCTNYPVESEKSENIDKTQILYDLESMLTNIEGNYAYLDRKSTKISCIRSSYKQKMETLKNQRDVLLFFETLLYEFYDSHLILNTNIESSYRLFAPVYASMVEGKPIITSTWYTQIENLETNIIGSQIIRFNGHTTNQLIDAFPTMCADKEDEAIRTWIINKILSGRYDEPRIMEVKLANGELISIDLDKLAIRKDVDLLSLSIIRDIGIIRINNALGEDALIAEFDKALDALGDTKGLIIDLRNTVDGGNTHVARGLMGRLTDVRKPYQKHQLVQNGKVAKSWTEYVSPRGDYCDKPLAVLVNRWTGSMGEGLAIGLEGMDRAAVVGTEMERLAGAMNNFSFKHLDYGYRLSTEKLYHVNGVPREQYVPSIYICPLDVNEDYILKKGLAVVQGAIKEGD